MQYPDNPTPEQRAVYFMRTYTLPGTEVFIASLLKKAEEEQPVVAANLRYIAEGARHVLETVRAELDQHAPLTEVSSDPR